MSVAGILRHVCSTERRQPVGTNGRQQMTPYLPSVRCMFTPMSTNTAIANNFEVGSGWDVYAEDGTDIQIGDKLTWNGTSYIVKGRAPFTGYGTVSSLKLLVETEKSNGN